MSVPGFTAESALQRTGGHYRTSGGGRAGRLSAVIPQDDSAGFCSMVECPFICRSACRGNPYGFRCQECLKDCRHECNNPGSDGPFTRRVAVNVW
ncbi:hypothetical protein BGM19_01145 [Streptomyces agglomeratus]|uniref:hypothetical protein n=1 Tax=Streptomyces agglomeratus TaxID=285458 RepID=UPI0008528121|nr:hypothetical protein [Streptomyces agglomeratus]OEJ56847.1 hypothetical protein BGM19_01145 [Streptomyces agglomeratus]